MNTEDKKQRYSVYEDSFSGHCCFEATVFDNTPYTSWDGELVEHTSVCECFEVKDAYLICKALNMMDEIGRKDKP